MKSQKLSNNALESLINMLASTDGVIRQKARIALVALGKPAVPDLIKILQNSRIDHVRWEAAKALVEIDDTRSIKQLVISLEDKDPDVAWLAAEALKKYKKAAWIPLLRMLLSRVLLKNGGDSVSLRLGAHHVLVHQEENGFNDLLPTLMKALELGKGQESAIVATYEILKRMKVSA